jgi:hypothetical protein
MAKKKATREKPPVASQPNSLSIRGSLEWREWLQWYAEQRRTTPTGLIDLALAVMAKQDKVKPPPRRI